jgi:hypothetical protein
VGTIKDHVQILRDDQTLLPGNEPTFSIPAHAATHELGGSDQIDGPIGIEYIEFDLSPSAVGASEGRLIWNDDDKTLNLGMAGGTVNMQIGQENLIRAQNTSGGPIGNGQVVYISGGTGSQATIALGDADIIGSAHVIGVATEDIASSQFGYVTTFGLVREVNTNGMAAGSVLYLSQTTGAFTTTKPLSPAFGVIIGQVIRSHATEGVIFVTIGVIPRIEDLSGVVSLGLYGFPNQTDTTVAFDDTTYTFTLGDAGSGWAYWRDGAYCPITGDKTVTLAGSPPTAGTYFIYIDDQVGTLTASTSSWTLQDTKVPVAIITWDDTATPKYWPAEERHQSLMLRQNHWLHHFTDGTEVLSGGAVSGYVVPGGGPSGDTDNTFAISQVDMADEDIPLTLAALPDPNGTDLDYIAYYRTGASAWSWEQSEVPFRYTPAGYIQWDNAGTMTQGQNNKYYNWYLCFTHYAGQARFLCVPGQSEFSSALSAYSESIDDLDLSGFDPQELVFAYQLTFLTNSGYSTKGKCKLNRAPFRLNVSRISASASGGSVDHNTTLGLQGGNGVDEFYHLNATTHGFLTDTQILAPDGAVGGPGIAFLGDPDTGFYRSSSGIVRFSSNNSNTVIFDSGGVYSKVNLTADGNVVLNSGGSIVTTSNGDLTLAPNGTGKVIVAPSGLANILEISDGGSITTTNNGDLTLAPNGTGSVLLPDGAVGSPDLLLSGDPQLLNGGTIGSTNNGDISLVPDGTGIVKVGSGSPTYASTSGDLFVQGRLEADGVTYAQGGLQIFSYGLVRDGVFLQFGTSSDTAISYQTAQTPDALALGVGTDSNGFIICQKADMGYDFAHAAELDPTLFIQSRTQSATEFLKLQHNTSTALISSGDALTLTTSSNNDLSLNPNGTGDLLGYSNSGTLSFSLDGATGIHSFPETSRFAANRSTTQSITSGTSNIIRFLTEEYDNRSEYDNTDVAGTGGIFTATEAGLYVVTWRVGTQSTAWAVADSVFTFLSYNGSTSTTATTNRRGERWVCDAALTDTIQVGGAAQIYLSATDTLRIALYYSRAAGNITTLANGQVNRFEVVKVA